MTQLHWFDGHLDLASLAVLGRDMLGPLDTDAVPHPPAAVTLPALRAGRVDACLATIFTESGGTDAVGYPDHDADAAHEAATRQWAVYEGWKRAGASTGMRVNAGALEPAGDGPLQIGILMEGADPIREPEEATLWVERGVVAIGLAWARGSRYSGGNAMPGGITPAGRELVRVMDELGVVHDASHLPDESLADLFSLSDRPVIASHSNVRALLRDNSQRHLSDGAIREIARRGGVIGVNLVSNFLDPLATQDPPRAARLSCVFDHIERICVLTEGRHAVALGSDMDGGFSAFWLPTGIDSPSDLRLIAEGLSDRGWSDEEVHGFTWGNWARFWSANGPSPTS